MDQSAQLHPNTRRLFGFNALIAWAGYGIAQVTNIFDLAPRAEAYDPSSNMFGGSAAGLAGAVGRLFDSHGYFTTWSNLLVALTLTALFLQPERAGRLFHRLRNTGLLMITMTMVLYHLLLAGTSNPQGLHAISNLLQHYITPAITILVWLIVGPRGRYSFSDTLTVFIIPIIYLAYTLIHGAAALVYPYPFFNVVKYGYASVLMLMGGVIAGGYVVALIYYGVERLRSRA
jgi:hypothetical protein